jgi:hypothetical protein
MSEILTALRQAHAKNTCTSCWYSCRGEVEVLYDPRGFADRMSTLLWQDSTQKPASPAVFAELARRDRQSGHRSPATIGTRFAAAPSSAPAALRIATSPDRLAIIKEESR